MSVITIIGSGVMGSALTFPALENGHEVRLVGTPLDRAIIERARQDDYHITMKRQLKPGCKYYQAEEAAAAADGADLIISGVSSFGVDWFADEMLPTLPDAVPILSVTKGLIHEDGEIITFPDYYARKHPNKLHMAVGGPCTSYELADHDHSHVCYCGADMTLLKWAKELMRTDYYHISLSTDVAGVESAVALKNGYALGVTLAVGLAEKLYGKQHYNSQAALFGQSIAEMRRALRLIGGGDDNIVYGAGDLYVTIFGGRSRKIGTLLGRGVPFEEAMAQLAGVTLESVAIATRMAEAVKVWIARGRARAADFPLLLHVDAILNGGAKVDIPWESFTSEGAR